MRWASKKHFCAASTRSVSRSRPLFSNELLFLAVRVGGFVCVLLLISALFIIEKDVIAQAQSGTGKTATFTVSVLQRIDENLPECQALVMAPTRELAQQVCVQYILVCKLSFCKKSTALFLII